MSSALLLARSVLAAVFAVAGGAKLADREGSRRAIGEFGAPAGLTAPLGVLLPLAELAIAAALVPAASARSAALAAAALLALFALAIAAALVRGRAPDCQCFGRLHSAPAGQPTLARNALLGVLALIVAARPAPRPGFVELAVLGAVALGAAQAWLWVELLRRYGRALRRIEELEGGLASPLALEVGAPVPPFVLPDLTGTLVTLETLLAPTSRLVLLFTHPGCGACEAALGRASEVTGARVAVVGVWRRDEVAARASEHELETVLVDEQRDVAPLYRVNGYPTAILVDGAGRLVCAPAVGAPAVAELLQAVDSSPPGTLGVRALAEGEAR